MRFFTTLLAVTLALVVVGNASTIQAQLVPFKASGDNAIYNTQTGETSGIGVATHMGQTLGAGVALPTADLGNGLFSWVAQEYSFTAANGDQLFLAGGGFVQFFPLEGTDYLSAIWSAEFTVVGGTGRFANASTEEPLAVVAVNYPLQLGDPYYTYYWNIEGMIDLGNE